MSDAQKGHFERVARSTPDTVEQAARAMMDKATDGLLVWETLGVAGQERYLDLAAAALSVVPEPDGARPDHACHLGCESGACETCACCYAGWCVFGLDGLPTEPDDLSMWLDVAAEHNPLVAAVRAVLDLATADDENRALSRSALVTTVHTALSPERAEALARADHGITS